ncbi:ASCH domain-containing protein [Schaalia sp. 19OD2882]|uniref:ASCH domain-containing protein n=1 Tax=Schaalia sp. 19OD2882 TaxID=2794089 RepID=UPI001C1EA39C|nr:ASCH domain-containing protein [Schaalia sp. 19OD2882]QWW19693.1 ASCH domain-containing protein [Schaalia sp. 19OD2882]
MDDPTTGVDCDPIDEAAVHEFWLRAARAIGVDRMDVVVGADSTALVEPPAWRFGLSRQVADNCVDLVVQGTKTATAGILEAYEAAGAPLPAVGELAIVCDARGQPRALLRTDRVRLVPFDHVDAAHAAAEGEGERSLQEWRRTHWDFLCEVTGRPTAPLPDPLPSDVMVLETFTCLYPKLPRRRA